MHRLPVSSSLYEIEERNYMKEKMSRWGVGPTFAFLSISYEMIMLAIRRYFHPAFQIPFVPYWLLRISGFH
jgi:hypothetical protein